MADDKEGGEPHKEQAPADAHVHSEELVGRSADTNAALSEGPVHAAAAQATDAHDVHGHGADAHGHGHDEHAIPADAIPEKSAYDSVLSMLAILVGVALVGLIVFWLSLKPAVVAEGEGVEHHAVEHAAPANTEPAPVH